MSSIPYILIFLAGLIIGRYVKSCMRKLIITCAKDNEFLEPEAISNIMKQCTYLFGKGIKKDSGCTYNKKKTIPIPLIEGLNGALYLLVVCVNGLRIESYLYCVITSALLIISVVDWYTFEIPFILNQVIFAASLVNLFIDWSNRYHYAFGFLIISVLLYFIFIVSKGRAIGGGDVKLMAAAGLGLGASKIVVAFFIACIVGSVIHILRMKVTGKDHMLALGPYLAFGVFISMLFGERLISWYFNVLL